MAEWHIDPVYIGENWPKELLDLMIEKMAERKNREHDTIQNRGRSEEVITDHQLFARLGVQVEKAGEN